MTRTLVETVAKFKSQIVEKDDAIEVLREKVQQLDRELREKVQDFDQQALQVRELMVEKEALEQSVTKTKEKMLLLDKQQKLQECLVSQHRQVAATTMALVARDARTKCTDYRRVKYIPNPRSEVVEEVLRAKKAIDKEAIAQLAATIDEIADRYYSPNPSNATCVKPALERHDGVTMDIDGGNGHEVLGEEGYVQNIRGQ